MSQPDPSPALLQQAVARLADRVPGDAGRTAAAEALARAVPTAVHWMNVAYEWFSAHRFADGHAALARALGCDPDFLPARWMAFQHPLDLVPGTEAEVDAFRQRWRAGLAGFEALDFREPRWRGQVWGCVGACSAFYLHYIDAAIEDQRRYGALVRRMMQALAPDAPQVPRPPGTRRIVFASAFLREHTVARLFVPMFERLDPERFEVHALALAPSSDGFAAALAPHVTLHREALLPPQWAERITRLAPDVLIYLDIGMHPLAQGLAALRLAPVQAVLWGHPVTTGLPTIDWMLSPDAMEPPDAQAHYHERLHRLPGLGNALRPPPPARIGDAPFHRRAGGIELFCAQSIYKLTPAHDALFATVLARLPGARLHLIPHEQAHVREDYARRMHRACAAAGIDVTDRLILHPLLPLPDYLALAGACDLALDTLDWSGGMSSLDLLGQGLPIVTCEGRLMRGRQTAALLRRLDAAELVAPDAAAWLDTVVALARDPARRDALSTRLRSNAPRLHDNDDAVTGLADFLANVRPL